MAETYHPRGELVEGFAPRDHPSYNTWAGIKSRCNNPDLESWENYGGRGITYCSRWKHFANFVADMGVPPFEGASIERVDNDQGYSKKNCVWATKHQQARNRRKFRNNTSGHRGVVPLRNGGFAARYDDHGKRYDLGRFDTAEQAAAAREQFTSLYLAGDVDAAFTLINAGQRDPALKNHHRLRRDSSTGVKGVSRHPDGGFIVRRTVSGERKYLGYAKTLSAALKLLEIAA